MKILKTVSVSALSLALAYGCSSSSSGGGSGDTTPNSIYTGTITGGDASRNGTEQKAIIYNNRMMILSNSANGVSQLFEGTLTEPATSLSGTGNRYDANGLELNDIAYSGSYTAGQSASVSFSEVTSGTATLAAGSIAFTADSALYNKAADLTKLAGTWTGTFDSGIVLDMVLVIDAAGNIVAGSMDQFAQGCVFTGAFTIADAALNVYNLNLISDGGSGQCTLPAKGYTGLAWTEGATDGTLVMMAADGNRGRAAVLTKN